MFGTSPSPVMRFSIKNNDRLAEYSSPTGLATGLYPLWKDLDSEQLERDEPTMTLVGVNITFDGASLGSVRGNFEIAGFEGEEDISSLQVLPLRLVKDSNSDVSRDGVAFCQDLIDRGRMLVYCETAETPYLILLSHLIIYIQQGSIGNIQPR